MDETSITCGMPQDSILGPLVLLLYINYMPQTVDSELLLYANDSCLAFEHKDVNTIKEHLNQDFLTLIYWLVDNKLSVHFGLDMTK